jgi:hypothetical protein
MSIILTFFLYNILIFGYYECVNRGLHAKKHKFKFLILGCILCGIVAAFRGESGSDTAMYRTLYYSGVNAIHRWESFETGYVFTVNVFRTLGLSFEGFLFFVAAITTGLITWFITKNISEINLFVACMAYTTDLYFFGFNGIRQTIAICVCICAIELIYQKKTKIAFLLIVLATFFHRSAAIVLLVLVLKIVIKNKKIYKFIIVGTILLILFFVLNREILGKIIYFITNSIYYESYATRDAETGSNIINYFIKQMPIILISYFGLMHCEYNNEKIKNYYALALFGITFSSIGSITQTQIARLGMYFSSFKIYVYGYVTNNRLYLTKKYFVDGKTIKIISIIYLYSLFIYNYFIKGFSNIVPYGLFR